MPRGQGRRRDMVRQLDDYNNDPPPSESEEEEEELTVAQMMRLIANQNETANEDRRAANEQQARTDAQLLAANANVAAILERMNDRQPQTIVALPPLNHFMLMKQGTVVTLTNG